MFCCSDVSLAIKSRILAVMLQGLHRCSAFRVFAGIQRSQSRMGSMACVDRICIIAAALQCGHSKFEISLHCHMVFCFPGVSLVITRRIIVVVLQVLPRSHGFQAFRWQSNDAFPMMIC